jgi:ABC-type antimicrobial peptide transport system permease subunit
MNTMWIAIRERTRGIGPLRAIGMYRFGVLRMFMLESLMLGFFGAFVGAMAGVAVSSGLNALKIATPPAAQLFLMSDTLHLAVHAGQVAFAVILLTLVTALAAFYPSFRAARLRPIEAMSHFG